MLCYMLIVLNELFLANDFQESACQEALDDMRQCCIKWGFESFVCGGIRTEPSKTENKK